MKKLFASLALVGMASLSFAQTAPAPALALSGYIDTGVTFLTNGVDATASGLWGEDAGVNGGRFKLIGKYANGDVGANFELRWDGLTTAPTKPFKSAYAYANFLGKSVLTQVGLVKDDTLKTGGDAGWYYAKETAGAVVTAKPLDGLAVQAFWAPATGAATVTSDSTGYVEKSQVAVGAAYTLKDAFKVVGSVSAQGVAYNGYAVTGFMAGASLLAVPNLTAAVEAKIEKLNDGGLNGKASVAETVSYGFKDLGVAPLSAGLIAYEYFYDSGYKTNGTAKDAYATALRLSPWASYALDGGVTPKLQVTYQSGYDALSDAYDNNLKLALPTAVKSNVNKVATLEVKPSVKFALTSAQTINVIYAFQTSVGEDDVVFLTKNNKDAKSLHTFQVDYLYSF